MPFGRILLPLWVGLEQNEREEWLEYKNKIQTRQEMVTTLSANLEYTTSSVDIL